MSGPSPTGQFPRWARVAMIGTGGFLVGVLVAMSLGRSGSQSVGRAVPAPPAVSVAESGPRSVDAGVPVGYAHTAAGAAAAATAYLTVAAEGLLLMDTPARDAALRRMLVPDASAQTMASVAGDPGFIDRVRKTASASGTPQAVVRNLPVAYRVEAVSDSRARVSVWADAVWSIAGVAGPGEAWTTTSLELEWIGGDWRLWSMTSKDGPTPATTSGPVAGTDELIGALAGFSGYRYGPA